MENTEHNCNICFYSEPAKGLAEYIFCSRRKEYRKPSAEVCGDYLYDIIKRPVRRKPALKLDEIPDFGI